MDEIAIPELSKSEIISYFDIAKKTERKRAPKILHNKGDYLNKVFNFMLEDSYMQPHIHPGKEKIEKMYLMQGAFALITFDDDGKVTDTIVLEKGVKDFISVPAFTWHTYVMLTDEVIVYEEMDGVYSPNTWKEMATWAPTEETSESAEYLKMLKRKCFK